MRRQFWLLVITLSGLLSACQTPKHVVTKEAGRSLLSEWLVDQGIFVERQQWGLNNPNWTLTAKVGLRLGATRESANVSWQVAENSETIRLFGPLGMGAVRVELSEKGATITDNKGRQYHGENAESLLLSVTGWVIPIAALRYWMLALPEPSSAYEYQVGDDGSISTLKQLGWAIQYSKYQPLETFALRWPRKVIAEKIMTIEGREQPVQVRLIVKSFSSDAQ